MANKPKNNEQPENECVACQSYAYFLTLSKTTDTKEAFHDAVDFAIENLIDDLADAIGEKNYSDGLEDGFADAYKIIAENLTNTAEILNEMNNSLCDDCDCEEGYCETEDDGTLY